MRKKRFKHSVETKHKMSVATRGKARKPLSIEHKENISNALKGLERTEEHRRNISLSRTGKKHSKKTREKMSIARRGEKCPFWKGGIASDESNSRNGLEYRLWREAVLERGDYTCFDCGSKEKLHTHHKKTLIKYSELRLDVDNGMVLCSSCHAKRHWNPKS